MSKCIVFFIIFFYLIVNANQLSGQNPFQNINFGGNNLRNTSASTPQNSNQSADSANLGFKKRDFKDDSILITYQYFTSPKLFIDEKGLADFQKTFQVSTNYFHLGNMGTPVQNYLFELKPSIGFRFGYEVFNPYFKPIKETKFYKTPKPYTQLFYQTGKQQEQQLGFIFSKNNSPYDNFSIEYHFKVFPGFIKNQSANQTQIKFTEHYLSKKKRYEFFFIGMFNKAGANENGGLVSTEALKQDNLGTIFGLNTRLGNDLVFRVNNFNTTLALGSIYKNNIVFFNQHYDIGYNDSLSLDTNKKAIFYPKLRIENISYIEQFSHFFANQFSNDTVSNNKFKNYFQYNYPIKNGANSFDNWVNYHSELNVKFFPIKTNTGQFLNIGAAYEKIYSFSLINSIKPTIENFYVQGEYSNRTKNNIWDIELNGQLYVLGNFSGNFKISASLKKLINNKKRYLLIGGDIVNRSPTVFFSGLTQFDINSVSKYKKENFSRFIGEIGSVNNSWSLITNYYFITNFFYLQNLNQASQFNSIFNVFNTKLTTHFPIYKIFKWSSDITIQFAIGNAPIHIPLLFTGQKFYVEGFIQKKLHYATGIEFIYASPFKVNGYNPTNSQFYLQDSFVLKNRPNINFFINININRFTLYWRFEELNNLNVTNGFSQTIYNFQNQYYPHNPFWTRFGIIWKFIN